MLIKGFASVDAKNVISNVERRNCAVRLKSS